MTMIDENVAGAPESVAPAPARQAVSEMIDAGLLDEVLDRADRGDLALTGAGGFLPELVKAVLERGLAAELTGHLGSTSSPCVSIEPGLPRTTAWTPSGSKEPRPCQRTSVTTRRGPSTGEIQ